MFLRRKQSMSCMEHGCKYHSNDMRRWNGGWSIWARYDLWVTAPLAKHKMDPCFTEWPFQLYPLILEPPDSWKWERFNASDSFIVEILWIKSRLPLWKYCTLHSVVRRPLPAVEQLPKTPEQSFQEFRFVAGSYGVVMIDWCICKSADEVNSWMGLHHSAFKTK